MSSAKTSAVAHNISDFAMLHNGELSGQSVLLTLLQQQVTLCSVPKYLMEATDSAAAAGHTLQHAKVLDGRY